MSQQWCDLFQNTDMNKTVLMMPSLSSKDNRFSNLWWEYGGGGLPEQAHSVS